MSRANDSNEVSPRVARKRARVRSRLLEAAAQIIKADGLSGLTVEAVARAADMSKPSVYYYFADKDALVLALVAERAKEERAAISAAVGEVPPGESVVAAVIHAHVAHHRSSLALFRAEYVHVNVVGFDPVVLEEEVNPGMVALFGTIERRLEQDAAAGRLHDGIHPRRTAFQAYVAAHGLVSILALLDASGTTFLHDVDTMVHDLGTTLTRGVYRDIP